jgi:hypothetical protein
VGMSLTYRLNTTGETSPPWATPARIFRRVEVADFKNVWTCGDEDMKIRLSPGKTGK